MTRLRILTFALVLLALFGLALIAYAYSVATRDPVVRRLAVKLPGYPAALPPTRIILVSDIHVAGPDMPPARLRRVVATINGLRPDVVLVAGDFVSDKGVATRAYSLADAVAPLGELRARFGVYAVLGNHDHWRDAAQARIELAGAGIRVLNNQAAVAGPLVIGGLDDDFTGHADLSATLARMRGLPGAKVLPEP